jgi:hypothetical protein
VVPEAAGVDRGGNEIVAQGVHRQKGRHAGQVPVVVAEGPPGQGGAGGRLGPDDADLPAVNPVHDEGQGDAREIAPAAGAAQDHVGVLADLFELLFRLQADDGLMKQDVVQNAPEGIPGVLAGDGILHGLADGDAEAPRRIGVLLEDLPSRRRTDARAGDALGPQTFIIIRGRVSARSSPGP